MVRIDRVVTRGGDGGMTSLGDGSRLRKDTPRVEAIGAVDEANAAVGWLRAALTAGEAADMLSRIQNDLFDVGADLCVPGEGGDRLRLTDVPIARLEAEVEAMNARLPPLTSFILPGGSEAAARAHMARVIVAARTLRRGRGGIEPGAWPVFEPAVGSHVRIGAGAERQRGGGCALAARCARVGPRRL